MVDTVQTFFDLANSYSSSLSRLAVFATTLILAYLVERYVVEPPIRRVLEAGEVERHEKRMALRAVRMLFIFAGITFGLGVAGYGSLVASFAAVAAAATIAVGFAAQEVIRNFVSGLFLYFEKPFRIGDWIEWGDHSGRVEDISLRVTRVVTFDNELLTVPNSELTGTVVKNPVARPRLRLRLPFGIGYDDDPEEASEIMRQEAIRLPQVLASPEPSVRVTGLADNYVELTSMVWIRNPDRTDFLRAKSEYIKAVKSRFEEAGISLPGPQRELSGSVDIGATKGSPSGDLGEGSPPTGHRQGEVEEDGE